MVRALCTSLLAASLCAAAAAWPAAAATWPADGASGVARDAQPYTDAAALQLIGPLGLPVPGVLRRSRGELRFDSAAALTPCTRYRLLAAGATRHFTTACSSWQPPQRLDTARHAREPAYTARGAQVAAADDAAWVVWSQLDHGRDAVELARYEPDTDAWSAPHPLDAGTADAVLPTLAAGDGAVWAAWSQAVHGRDAIDVLRIDADGGAPRRVDRGGDLRGDATDVQLGVASGVVALAWQQRAQGHGAIGVALRQHGRWMPARRLDRGATGAYAPALAVAADGTVFVAWQQGRGAAAAIDAACFTRGRWSSPRRIGARGDAHAVTLVALPDGGVAAAWVRRDRLEWRQLDAALRGAAPRPLSAAPAARPALAVDAAGNLTLVWQQGVARSRIVARRLDAASSRWSAPRQLDAPDLRGAGSAVLGVDASGDVACAWYQDGPQGLQIEAARYDASSGRWSPAQQLSDPRSTVQAVLPALAVDAAGSVTVVWQQFNDWRDIVMSRRLP